MWNSSHQVTFQKIQLKLYNHNTGRESGGNPAQPLVLLHHPWNKFVHSLPEHGTPLLAKLPVCLYEHRFKDLPWMKRGLTCIPFLWGTGSFQASLGVKCKFLNLCFMDGEHTIPPLSHLKATKLFLTRAEICLPSLSIPLPSEITWNKPISLSENSRNCEKLSTVSSLTMLLIWRNSPKVSAPFVLGQATHGVTLWALWSASPLLMWLTSL